MKIKNYITGSILFITILACVGPGLSQPVPPTFDLNLIPTMVVLTANALEAQTAVAALQIPLETPTLTPAESVSATPRISLSGTSLLLRDDQTTLFTDREAGIELIVPAGWLAVRLNEQEYYDAWILPELSDPAFQRSLANIKDLNPNEFRLFALDVQEGHLLGGFVTNINLFWGENDDMSLDDDTDLQNIADSDSEATPGLDILTTDISVTSSGIPIGVITYKRSGTTMDGRKLVVFYKQLFVKARTGVLTITLTTTEELRDAVLPAFDAMIETMTLVKE
jgi:hypothetical protein